MHFLKTFLCCFILTISLSAFSQSDTIVLTDTIPQEEIINNILFQEEELLEEDTIMYQIEKANTLKANYDSLQTNYNSLINKYDSLQINFEKGEYTIKQMEIQNAKLLGDYEELENEIASQKTQFIDDTLRLSLEIDELRANSISLKSINDTLALLNKEYRFQLNEKNTLLEEKIKILNEKEILFTEKEQLYKEAINTSNIDKTKIEGQVQSKNAQIEGKDKEIGLLQKNIDEKDASINEKNTNLAKVIQEKDKYYLMADTLRNKLVETEKTLLKLTEELKYTKQRAAEAEAKIAQATGRKKKVRVIQGSAMRYPSPVWDIVPRATETGYENIVVNRNSSKVDFDFITGASVMLYDLTKPDDKFASDISLYVGFGGSNLFKNFYIGGSYRFLDFFHIAVGTNIAEYTLLAEEFNKEGQALKPGWSIQTTKQWKVTPFISLSLDFEFLSYIGKK